MADPVPMDVDAKPAEAAEAKRKKPKTEDHSALVDARLPELQKLADSDLDAAVEAMLSLEKTARLGEDTSSTARVVVAIVKLFYDRKDWKALNSYLLLLSKRKGQLKGAVSKMVQAAMTYLEAAPEPEKLELIDTLRLICEGKIHVELERARLTLTLAGIKEAKGQIAEAADILQSVQVETFGSMDNREKFSFILEQMRLALLKGDYIRTEILSRKVAPKALRDVQLQDLKLKFFELMTKYYQHERRYLDLVRANLEVYATPMVVADEKLWQEALRGVCAYLALSPHDNEQSDMLNRVYLDKKLDQLPAFKQMLKYFLTSELMRWAEFEKQYRPLLQHIPYFGAGDDGTRTWKDMHKRVTEHNIRVVSKYYSRITTARLATLLALTLEEAEQFLCDMVVGHGVYARVDRPAGVIAFSKPKTGSEQLNEWSHGVGKLLELVESTCHLISKENVVQQSLAASAAAAAPRV